MKFTQIKETCLYVSDLEKTKSFYCNKLGLELISLVKGRHVFFRAGTSVLLCFIAETTKDEKTLPPHFASGQIHLALEVEIGNYDNCKENISLAGIKIEHEEEWGNDFRSFYFRDPDNHLLEVVQKGMWGE